MGFFFFAFSFFGLGMLILHGFFSQTNFIILLLQEILTHGCSEEVSFLLQTISEEAEEGGWGGGETLFS